MTASAASRISHSQAASSGGRLMALDGRPFSLEGSELRAEASSGLARVVLEQRFRNPYDEPLHATYQVPLPHDAAVSGYAFRVGERLITGEVDRKAAARKRFEEALLEGRSAALFEQERTSLFTQEIGNIPPHALVVAEVTLDQRLGWRDAGEWEWRFPTVVAPRYLGGEGEVTDADRVTVPVADPAGKGFAPRAGLRLAIGDALSQGGAPSSPSHALSVSAGDESESTPTLVSLAGETVRLDRDVVVRWPVASRRTGVTFVPARPQAPHAGAGAAYGLLTLVPPLPEAQGESLPRDLIVLLDTSGSMSGQPLAQAKAVVRALIESLGPADRLELIEFSSSVGRWRRRAAHADEPARRDALAWLARLEAGGGTDMVPGILGALASARDGAQRQVVLVTDGLIGFESKVVAAIRTELAPATRVHSVGVGSAVNRSLTAAAARAGRGAEVLIGLGEDPVPAIAQLLARTCAPLVTQLEIAGSALLDHAPAAVPDLFAGAPARIGLRLRPEGGSLVVRGLRAGGGKWEERIDVPPVAAGTGSTAVVALYARERVEDLETDAAAGEVHGTEAQIERIGLDFQIATRMSSWVAISEEPSVDPGQPIRRERIPQLLPKGLSAEGLGLRAATRVSREVHFGSMVACLAEGIPSMERISKLMPTPMRRTPSAPAAPPRHTLAARIAARRGRRLVIEVELPFLLDWQPGGIVTVSYPNSPLAHAAVDPARTSRPGLVDAGCTLRLAVELDAEPGADAPSEILLECAGIPLRLQIVS